MVRQFVSLGTDETEEQGQGYRQKFIYCLGGMLTESKISIPNRTIERYDIAADRWYRVKC